MSNPFGLIDQLLRQLCIAALAISAIFIGLLAMIGAADIFGTSLLGMPVPSALELSEAALVIVVFMGLAQAQRRRGHITVDILSSRLTGIWRTASVALALLAAITFFGFIGWRGGIAAWESVLIDERSMGQSSFPIYPGKILLCLGCMIAATEALRQFIHLLFGRVELAEVVND
jgi:TRAP-type C4-dicarboxylate transport system permease small subunit